MLREPRTRKLESGTPIEQHAPDRVCAEPACAVRLSRYNPAPTCAAHAGWTDEPGGAGD